jgi:hypothetical protein
MARAAQYTIDDPSQLAFELAPHVAEQLIDFSRPFIDHEFPIGEANALAEQEAFNKHLFRPNTYLHKWWARRAGTTFRFILKQLAANPRARDYYQPRGLEGVMILDPMMGGGTTLHEALRLGAKVIGNDIDPIPVLQAKASLAALPLSEKAAIFNHFLTQLRLRLGRMFRTCCPACGGDSEIQFTLHGRLKACACGPAVVVDSFRLREEDSAHVELCAKCFAPKTAGQPHKHSRAIHRVIEKSQLKCGRCGEEFEAERKLPFYRRYVPVVIVGQCPVHGTFFKGLDKNDRGKLAKIEKSLCRQAEFPAEEFSLINGPKSKDLLSRNVTSFADVFSNRQLLYLRESKRLLDDIPSAHHLWLTLLISTSLEFNSLLCGYKGVEKRRPGAIRHVFSHHAYSIPHTALENNPVFSRATSGTLKILFRDRIEAAAKWAAAPIERKRIRGAWIKLHISEEQDCGVEVSSYEELLRTPQSFLVNQRDSTTLPLPDHSVDHVVTDPPYFDSVQYSDLAQFFRVWLRWLAGHYANWSYSPNDSAVAESSAGAEKYSRLLGAIWKECNRVLKRPAGRLIFTFHHWRAEAWVHLTLSLLRAEFKLLATHTIHSENPISVHIRTLDALKHDTILVLAPKDAVEAAPLFQHPDTLDSSSSESFCSDCGTLLGYCLNTPVPESEVERLWTYTTRRQ